MPVGIFITLEGGDGSGKSTQVEALAARLRRRRVPVTKVREPGSTRLGNSLRRVIKNPKGSKTPMAELLIFNASRVQLVTEVIRPALEKGDVVISDRFADSTLAYQGYGRGISLKTVEEVNEIGTDGLKPNLSILLDLPEEERHRRANRPEDAFERKEFIDFSSHGLPLKDEVTPSRVEPTEASRRSLQGALFEEGDELTPQFALFKGGKQVPEVVDFLSRVRQGYLEMARAEPERWYVIDARLPQEEITQLIWQRVESLLSAVRGEAGPA